MDAAFFFFMGNGNPNEETTDVLWANLSGW